MTGGDGAHDVVTSERTHIIVPAIFTSKHHSVRRNLDMSMNSENFSPQKGKTKCQPKGIKRTQELLSVPYTQSARKHILKVLGSNTRSIHALTIGLLVAL